MPLLARAPIRIQPYFGHRQASLLVLKARALRSEAPQFEPGGSWQAFRTMLAQFASHESAGVEVTLEIERPGGEREHHRATTDREGFVHFRVALGEQWQLPERTSWETVRLLWRNRHGEQAVAAHVLAPGRSVDLGIVSDIDDTIIETGITGGIRSVLRNWRRILQQMPEERLAVPGVDVFYNALGGADPSASAPAEIAGAQLPASHRPFFYVSSSPWNLFSYLVAFKRLRGLPLGPIELRDWGLNREILGSSGHGRHKLDAIREILAHHPELRFVLIGDDSQGDLVAFAEIAKEFSSRIAAVFIRRVGEAHSPEEVAARKLLEDRGVRLWMGDSFAVEQDFLEATGLGHDPAAERVVEATQAAASEDG